jgi:hypothetical protein
LNRRELTVEAALALLGGATITLGTLGGCENSTEPSPVIVDVSGVIASNHGHAVTIAAAELRAGGALDLDIKGTAGHTHVVSLSTVDLALIRNGASIQKESSGTRHTHLVTFRG